MAENISPGGGREVNYPLIYLYDLGILGELIRYNAHASMVAYSLEGMRHETIMLNEDFEIVQELDLGLDYYE